MKKELVVKQTINLQASPSDVWKVLTDPADIKKYFFGTETESDWRVGSPVVFRGEWEGKEYIDKGTILESEPGKKLVYDYWSSFSGIDDIPENYSKITYLLTPQADGTLLEITQEGFVSEENRDHSDTSWKSVLENIREVLYSKTPA